MTESQATAFVGSGRFMTDRRFYLQLLGLAWPIALQNIVAFSVSLTDSLMIKELGSVAVSGVYVSNQLTTFLQMITAGITAALIILASQYQGRGDRDSVREIVSLSLRGSVIIAALMTLLVQLWPRQLLAIFTNEPEVIEAALPYLSVLSWIYVFFVASNVMIASMRVVMRVRIGLLCSVIAFATNLPLNWLLIFGNLGFPRLGLRGAAIATLIAWIIEAAVLVVIVFVQDEKLGLRLRHLRGFDRALLRDFFRYGLPVVIGDMTWGINMMVQGMIIGRLGTAAIAAVSVTGTLLSVMAVMIYGIRDGTAIMIGQAVGRGNMDEIKRFTRSFQLVFLAFGAVTAVMIWFGRPLLLSFYAALDQPTLELADKFLQVLAVVTFGTAYQMSCLTGIVRAGGKTHFVLINDLLWVWLWVLPSAALAAFVFNASPVLVFFLLKSDQLLKCIVAVIETNSYRWVKQLTRERTPAGNDGQPGGRAAATG
ncbi:MAG: MATE family efflux transporter [Bacillota bacterium]|nr:MATE family efflux transporter [Bacillota bacterium]